ncbi:MAG: ATP-dependent Clp protease ATP-binding subunit, partial [bacterium]
EKDAALERRFQTVKVPEPSIDDAIRILKGIRHKYEEHHNVRITDEAIETAVRLTDRYLSGRHLPDKAIDTIDEAGARSRILATTRSPELRKKEQAIEKIRLEKEVAIKGQVFEDAARLRDLEKRERDALEATVKKWQESAKKKKVKVTEEDVMAVVSKWTGVPLKKMEGKELTRLLNMEMELEKTVIGQRDAIVTISKALRRSRADLKDPRRPIGSFVFLGPTGVGKTLLAKTLAEFMFDDANSLIQLDMSEYMEKFTVSRLVGSPPGYVGYDEGGQLTEKIRRRPYSVVLFDEIEKAHPDVMHMLLQIMEEGRLTDSAGRNVDFRNTVIILTTNLGADYIRKSGLGFTESGSGMDYEALKARMLEEVKRLFKPEFINRLDEIVVFRQFARPEMVRILELEIRKVKARLETKGIKLVLTAEAEGFLLDKGFDLSMGARPLRRAVQRYLEDPLAEEILRGDLKNSGTVDVIKGDGGLVFRPTGKVKA